MYLDILLGFFWVLEENIFKFICFMFMFYVLQFHPPICSLYVPNIRALRQVLILTIRSGAMWVFGCCLVSTNYYFRAFSLLWPPPPRTASIHPNFFRAWSDIWNMPWNAMKSAKFAIWGYFSWFGHAFRFFWVLEQKLLCVAQFYPPIVYRVSHRGGDEGGLPPTPGQSPLMWRSPPWPKVAVPLITN